MSLIQSPWLRGRARPAQRSITLGARRPGVRPAMPARRSQTRRTRRGVGGMEEEQARSLFSPGTTTLAHRPVLQG